MLAGIRALSSCLKFLCLFHEEHRDPKRGCCTCGWRCGIRSTTSRQWIGRGSSTFFITPFSSPCHVLFPSLYWIVPPYCLPKVVEDAPPKSHVMEITDCGGSASLDYGYSKMLLRLSFENPFFCFCLYSCLQSFTDTIVVGISTLKMLSKALSSSKVTLLVFKWVGLFWLASLCFSMSCNLLQGLLNPLPPSTFC
jgi:hypothetical protein